VPIVNMKHFEPRYEILPKFGVGFVAFYIVPVARKKQRLTELGSFPTKEEAEAACENYDNMLIQKAVFERDNKMYVYEPKRKRE